MSFKKLSRSTMVLFLLVSLVFPLLNISKVFIIPHCLAFDVNDDANHTFINLEQWRRILSQGEWPMMNVYNNFGTPLLGDVITYPLSPLALTHALLPGPVAMTINRALIGFVSLFLLFIFYHRRFPKIMSIGLGLCTFYGPGFLWHSAHHHFQMALLLLTAIFLLQETFTQRMSAGAYIGICLLSIVMFLSVSINVVLIMCLLIVGYQVFLSGGIKVKSLWIVLSGLLCGVIVAMPDILLFLEAAARSMRSLAQYPVASWEGPNKIFWTPVAAAFIYCLALYREKNFREAGLIFWLGVFPYSIVLLSKTLPYVWDHIPLLGATDVVRLTWGASIFLMMGCGGLLLRWLKASPGWRWETFICLLGIALDAYYLPFRQEWVASGKFIMTFVWGLACLGFVSWIMIDDVRNRIKEITIARWMAGFIGSAVVIVFLYYGFFDVLGFSFPRVCHVTGHPAFSEDGSEKFLLREVPLVIPKDSRVAYDFNTMLGLDLRGAREGLFGAGARSTIMTNKDFAVRLFSEGLVKFDNYTGDYHFSRPWRAKDLQALGISFVAQDRRDDSLIVQGWKPIGHEQGPYLYQNPLPSGVVFLKKGEEISPVPFVVKGNGLDVHLPGQRPGTQELVISLLKIPGWRAWIDGKERDLLEGDHKFLVLTILPNDHFVRVRYLPFEPIQILLCFFIALGLPWLIVRIYFIKK